MRAPADWSLAAALLLLGLDHAAAAHHHHASRPVTDVCESRTINYITHTLPQQCLRTAWTSPTPPATDSAPTHQSPPVTTIATTTTTTTATATDNGTAQDQDAQEELAASSFMSFEEWKEMMLRKSGQDPANIKPHRHREHHPDRDPAMAAADMDTSFGEDGEISFDFDALAEKVSEITSTPTRGAVPDKGADAKDDQPILYDDGKTQYYRSKDAGKTCKERFSYSSFDAGATVLKTGPGTKNAKAILLENKDSYMLLECRAKNKFVVVELSDDILIDTIVLANFEFFSSMIRSFRVSVSDRYPVKFDKWVDLGTFEARNSRDIQAFLIEHPQIYTKYVRVEFLTHWGNEFYCPVSLLRVHGTRMLDSWKEPAHDDEPEQIQATPQMPKAVPEPPQTQESTAGDNSSTVAKEKPALSQVVLGIGLTPWAPLRHPFLPEMCELPSPTTAEPTPVESAYNKAIKHPPPAPESVTPRPSAAQEGQPNTGPPSDPASPDSHGSQGLSMSATSASAADSTQQDGNDGTTSNASQKRSDGAADGSSSATTTTPRNKTSTAASSASASPTVQESFFKTITKRLQLLESNTSLSLQYIEEQSRFLQEVLLKMERKQITRVDSFLDTLNKTVLSELRSVRTQYDQIWQSTVIALESQRDQSQREIVALTSRLNVLADEVVFQKRMAILQSVLLLACLVLVIFSRGGLAALDGASFPTFSPTSPPYRRYGYADSISGLSIPAAASPSLPPRPATNPLTAAAAARGETDPATLAASALPRHLYPSSSAASSFKDKSLPLTPPSEYSRENTPARATPAVMMMHQSPSPPPSFYQQHFVPAASPSPPPPPPQLTDGVLSSIENVNESLINGTVNGSQAEPEAAGEQGGPNGLEREPGPTSRPRSAMSSSSQSGGGGGLRKPLPALPEDPS
ncbi:UNC-like C-terminal-domain-containing protein [Staphylotrichum tortipilum]|uniref:UNC-like C-terminal-domain-containing protein n=1 Tax=Staphylotrichum tortipilum TaxID=2831512 RepID=A0AAN6RT12_9PEZI|nr:UNC-like C-terminal-domain-containing protein [Staphylotrichum longicolle]